jgi:hypothetical protein
MARQYTRLADIQYVPSSAGTVYTNPASTKSYVKSLVLFNGNSTTETIKLHNVPNTSNGDTDIDKVELLLHMDGSNGSTTFTDSSSNNLTLAVNGSAAITTSQKKFGTGAADLTGSGENYLSYPSASGDELDIASGQDFTIEFWAYVTAVHDDATVSGSTCMFETTSSGGTGITLHMITVSSTPTLSLGFDFGASGNFAHQTALTLNQWLHIAIVRSSNVFNLYLDGIKSTSSQTFSNALPNGLFFVIGPRQNGLIKLYVDDFRVTTGFARYTADFTPPIAAFANDAIGNLIPGAADASNQFAEIDITTKDTTQFDLAYPITLIDENDTIQASTTTADKVTIQLLGDRDA